MQKILKICLSLRMMLKEKNKIKKLINSYIIIIIIIINEWQIDSEGIENMLIHD